MTNFFPVFCTVQLNDKGFVEEETRIHPGDFIIGKVSQIRPDKNNSN